MEIPVEIRNIISERCGNICNIGLSGATVHIYDDMVLKIQKQSTESERELAMMDWLKDKMPVPRIIEHANANKLSFFLMSKCSGKMACDQEYMQQPKHQAELLASALHEIWQVDWEKCPYSCV